MIIGMKVLFICNQNKNRSKTAKEIFKGQFKTKSVGLYNAKPVRRKELLWADNVVVMEESQRTEIANRFPDVYIQKRILSLEIADVYHHNQPSLIKILKSKVNSLL